MGAVPKHKISSQRQGKRRRAIKLQAENVSPCPKCQKPKRHHQACPYCGYHHSQKS